MSIQTEIDRIIGLVSDSHDKVKSKGGTTEEPYLLASLPSAIESIPEGIDTSDATATAADMAEGVTAYVDGEKIIGEVPVLKGGQGATSLEIDDVVIGDYDDKLSIYGYLEEKTIVPSRFLLGMHVDTSVFGDATAEDVMRGKTFTSADSFSEEGRFSLDSEMSAQNSLISQIQTALQGKAAGGGSGGASSTISCYTPACTYSDGVATVDFSTIAIDERGLIDRIVCGVAYMHATSSSVSSWYSMGCTYQTAQTWLAQQESSSQALQVSSTAIQFNGSTFTWAIDPACATAYDTCSIYLVCYA